MGKTLSIEDHFGELIQLASADERERYLSEVSAENPDLRSELEALLGAHDQAGSFLGAAEIGTTAEVVRSELANDTIGRYKLREQIGEGGMGVVFVAEQREPLRRKVALKIIKPGMDSEAVIARFEAERQALAVMDHPNIARVFDAGTTDQGRPYFVMELVSGIEITQYCDQRQLTIRGRLELFQSVCEAIQHAHQKGIIHRDIKPSNVLVTEQDGKAVPKVIDFGVAKAMGGQSLTDRTIYTSFQSVIGTPLYMSPEQAALSNVDVDTRSDVYSLGVLLYELLTGTTPLDEETFRTAAQDEVLRMIREQDPPKPSTRISTLGEKISEISLGRQTDVAGLGRTIRGDLDWIVMTALEKDRSRRYDSANRLSEDIGRYLNNELVEARPPSTWYRLRKSYGRNKAIVLSLGVVFLTLVVGLGTSLWFYFEAVSSREKLRQLYFREALVAAMSGNDVKTNNFIEEGGREGLDILRDEEIRMIEGQRLVFRGELEKGYAALSEACELMPDIVLPWALLSSARTFGGGGGKQDIDPLVKAESLAVGRPLSDLELLFLGQAQFYLDTAKGNETLSRLSPELRTPIADAILADGRTHFAHDFGDQPALREALERFERAYAIMPDNPYVLASGVWSHVMAMRFADPDSREYERYLERGHEIAARMDPFMHFPFAAGVRAFFASEVNDEKQLRYCAEFAPSLCGFFLAAKEYPEISNETRETLGEGMLDETYSRAWASAGTAMIHAFADSSSQTAMSAFESIAPHRRQVTKWLTPEIYLLTQTDNELRKAKCRVSLANAEGLSDWDRELIAFIGTDELAIPLTVQEACETRIQESRLFFAAALKALLFAQPKIAKRHLEKCVGMQCAHDACWAEALLRRMDAERDWRAGGQ